MERPWVSIGPVRLTTLLPTEHLNGIYRPRSSDTVIRVTGLCAKGVAQRLEDVYRENKVVKYQTAITTEKVAVTALTFERADGSMGGDEAQYEIDLLVVQLMVGQKMVVVC